MKMVRVHNVKNIVTGETGNLLITVNKNSMEKFLRNNPPLSEKDYVNDHKGISFFFEGEGRDPECILTYVITQNEYELLKEGRIDCLKDVSFLLAVQNSYIMMVKMYLDNVKLKDSLYGVFKSDICHLELNVPRAYWNTVLKEECENSKYGICGFRLAVSKACQNINVKDDILVSSMIGLEDLEFIDLYTVVK